MNPKCTGFLMIILSGFEPMSVLHFSTFETMLIWTFRQIIVQN